MILPYFVLGFPGGSEAKASTCNAGDLGSITGSGRSPGEGNGNPLQYSCLENPMDRRAWLVTVHGFSKSRTRLSDFTFTCFVLVKKKQTNTLNIDGFSEFTFAADGFHKLTFADEGSKMG